MILNSRNNLFMFSFPKGFCPEEVSNRYKKYLTRIPGNLITEPIDFLSYSVQSISYPTTTYDPVEQSGIRGTRYYRTARPIRDLISNDLTITMQLLDGYINYWMMLDILTYWYNFDEPEMFIPPGMSVRILDSEGLVVVTTEFKNVLYKEIGSLDMSFSNNSVDFTTFDINFTYNWVQIGLELD